MSSPTAEPTTASATTGLARRVLKKPVAFICTLVLTLIAGAGIFASWLAPFDPNDTDVRNVLAAPGGDHLLGTDGAGRDVLSRLLYGTQISLASAALAVVIAVVIGVGAGLVAGYFGGWFDTISNWIISLVMALPGIVVLLAASTILGPSIWNAMMVFGVLLSPAFFRLVYVTVRGVRNELYIDAARVSGLSDVRIILRHVLSVVRAPIIIQIGIISSIAISIQAGLQFLGLGDLDVPTWGALLVEGFSKMFRQPWLLVWPSLALAITSVALALLANAIRDEMEGRGPRADAATPLDVAEDSGAEAVRHSAPEETEPPLLEVSDLMVGYPTQTRAYKPVVRSVSLSVRRGEVMGLIGESGSGKTQSALAVLGLLPATGKVMAGSVFFDGTELLDLNEKALTALRGRRIAYIPQEPMSNLDPSFTIGSQLVEPLRVCLGLSRSEAKQRALELLAKVGIPQPDVTFAAYPHEISGGMAQRVLIAGAVSCEPELIIADEPTTALDVTVQAEILDLLRELQTETNCALLMVTHNFGVVADLCDNVAVMQHGRIVESGPVRAIFESAEHPYTQSLLDAILEGGPARSAYVEPLSKAGSV